MSEDTLPHVPVGKLYYRLNQPEISNHGGTRFTNLSLFVGISQRWASYGCEVECQLQSDSGRTGWYALRMVVRTDARAFTNEENPYRIADKMRLRFIDTPHQPDCHLLRLGLVLAKMRAIHAVFDERIGRICAVKDLLPENYHAWRDDWRQMGRDHCTFDAVARDEEEARALMVLQAKRDVPDPEYLKAWLAAGAPLKRLTSHRSPPYVGSIEQHLHTVEAAAA